MIPKDHLTGAQMHALFERWSYWSRTHRYFSSARPGNFNEKSRDFCLTDSAVAGFDLSALHLAIVSQPLNALDTRVFMVFYSDRAAYIKRAAHELGISRQHFYRLLHAFCRRVYAASQQIADSTQRSNTQIT